MRARVLSLVAASCAAVLVAGTAAAHEAHAGGHGCRERHGHAPAEKAEKAEKAETAEKAEKADPGPVTVTEGDFYPTGDGASRVFGYAKMVRHDKGTEVTVHLSGLRPHRAHSVHVHSGPCRAHGPHYKHDPDGPGEPPNELWPSSDPDAPDAGLVADGEGYGTARAEASWTARPEAASVMLHHPQTHEMMACADLH